MSERTPIKEYKAFNPDWTCRGKQYTCPGLFEEDVEPSVCNAGMHFCKKVVDCFDYYRFDPNNKVAEVVAYGVVAESGGMCCTDKLRVVREIPWPEVLELTNTGKGNTGKRNSGNWNSGSYNSGDWNLASSSNGCFNTTSPKIYLFDKPSEWTLEDWRGSAACGILAAAPRCLEWGGSSGITDEEYQAHPEAVATGGCLKKSSAEEVKAQMNEWWKGLSKGGQQKIKSIPNFDAEIFEKITGINIKGGDDE